MPPKSRKRTKAANATTSESHSRQENQLAGTKSIVTDTSTLASASSSHKGFLALPNEIVSMILSYFPEIQTKYILANPTFINGCSSAPDFFQRFDTLRALSQTCRYSRQIYLPLLWERFQVCLITNPHGAWFRQLGMTLERRSKGMLDSPHLWPYVQVITVSLTRFQTSNVLPPFAQLLRTLPNVHTLEISHAHSAITGALKGAFEGSVFPTIQKVIMPTCAHEILRCCPGVREVTCNEDDGGRLVDALAHGGCSKLEVIQGIAPGPVMMKRFIKAVPPLRRIRINGRPDEREKVIQACSAFPSLRVLELDCGSGNDVDHLVKLAKDALRTCAEHKPPGKAKKSRARKNATDTERSLSEPRDLYSDPKVVRVVYPPCRNGSHSGFVPERVVVFPI